MLAHHPLDEPARHGLHIGTYDGEPRLLCHDRAAVLLQLCLLSDEDALVVTLWCSIRVNESLNVRRYGRLGLGSIGNHAGCSWLFCGFDVFDSPFFLPDGCPVERVHT